MFTKMIEKALPYIAPPGKNATPEQVRNWRWVVTAGLVGTVLMFAWFLGAFPFSSGVVFADTVVHPVSSDDFQAVVDKLDDIETEQIEQGGYLKQLVKSDLRDQINRLVRSRCEINSNGTGNDDAAKDLINRSIADYQTQYRAVTDHDYTEPDCEDL